ncbi:MAG: hypothetical protein ACOYVD_11935 [Bacillota bacterium]
MDNHIHLMIVAERHVLINVMKKINLTYAMFYNQRYKQLLIDNMTKEEIMKHFMSERNFIDL